VRTYYRNNNNKIKNKKKGRHPKTKMTPPYTNERYASLSNDAEDVKKIKNEKTAQNAE
jgi:hypothetical protein